MYCHKYKRFDNLINKMTVPRKNVKMLSEIFFSEVCCTFSSSTDLILQNCNEASREF